MRDENVTLRRATRSAWLVAAREARWRILVELARALADRVYDTAGR